MIPSKRLRYAHMALSPLAGAFVYSDSLRTDPTVVMLVQWVGFPLMAGLGLLLWWLPRRAAVRRPSAFDHGESRP